MVDVFLIVCTVVAFVILLVVGFYLLVYYQHPDDHNTAYFPKGVVVLGFVLAGATVLLLPLDVANNEGYPGMCLLYRCLRVMELNPKLVLGCPGCLCPRKVIMSTRRLLRAMDKAMEPDGPGTCFIMRCLTNPCVSYCATQLSGNDDEKQKAARDTTRRYAAD
jgi:uncharacterized membrane protein